ncbi:hypothetical protein RvY_08916 [Ramazzottius varieornatus]|uniref:Rab-GAP TBC domain-containing protein n=1 Tax=Ramazzottius varieornatus TaxID=947166 RepID=A0A1D1VD46_RAMVA|nr:hypothetical protein RvY_08916 [Ramazzottius varieornatus]
MNSELEKPEVTVIKCWDAVNVLMPKLAHSAAIAVPEKVIGSLSVVSKERLGTSLEWSPWKEALLSEDGTYAEQVNCTMFSTKTGSYRIPHVSIDIEDVKCFKVHGDEVDGAPVRLTFITNDGTSHSTLELDDMGYQELIAFLQERLMIERSVKDPHLCLVRDRRGRQRRQDLYDIPNQSAHFLQRFAKSPVTTAFLGLSKVHSMLMTAVDVLAPPMMEDGGPHGAMDTHRIPDFQLPPISMNNLQTTSNDDQDFEVISIKPPLELPPRHTVHRRAPLTATEWKSFFDSEGRITDEHAAEVKDIVFRGGVDVSLRKEVWKYLLGYYDWNATMEERRGKRELLAADYYRMKSQWSTISPEQEKRFSIWRERKDLIEKDVHRTDRNHPFFEGKSAALKVMNELLMTYCMLNFDLGYVQGMSDLLTPVMVIMEGDEVDTFWTFCGLMDSITHNFDMEKLMKELDHLSTLMKYLDPSLKRYIDANDPKLYFCFRWLLVHFKREFSFEDVMRLWEVLWTGRPCKNFHLLVAYAILDTEKNTLVENKFSSTEILRHINDLAMTINLEKTLELAESIYLQLIGAEELPSSIRKIIGLPIRQESSSENSPSRSSREPSKATESQRLNKTAGSPGAFEDHVFESS